MAAKRGDVGFEDIMALFRQEYGSPQLSKVGPDFYQKMASYVRSLRRENEKEIATNPGSQASMMLSDQLKKAGDKAKRIYELRQRKIALLALRKVAGDSPETANLTPDELVLYSSLVSVLGAHRDSNADIDDSGPRFSNPKDVVQLPEASQTDSVSGNGGASETDEGKSTPLVLVRVLEDIPTFAGVDKDYTLRREDVITLPKEIAETLASHGKIRVIESS
ncbi:MAG: DNA replication complex GINS family protein [Methanobacteriota archaeon]|nr:MAG: DNA replication complex GINS family protein [Euryarchaeota archaeon]